MIKGIEQYEGYKIGTVIEVYPITKAHKNKKGDKIDTYYIEGKQWVAKDECMGLAKQGKVELEICTTKSKKPI